MLTIDLTEDQVQTLARAEVSPEGRMSAFETRQKLDDVMAHLEQADRVFQKEVKSHLDRAIVIMLDIDEGQGWGNLGYRSIRHMIQVELEPRFNRSGSQFYRLFDAAKLRRKCKTFWPNVEEVPTSQLNEFGKLPCEQWEEAFEEITSLAPKGKITTKHIKEVVDSRRPSKKRAVENINDNGGSENYQPPGNIMERNQNSTNIVVGKIVVIHGDSATPSGQQYKGCWGMVRQVLESTAIVAVCGELVEYSFSNLLLVENPTPILTQVCDRITMLWQVASLPASVRHLLATFYQPRLDFLQEDLDVLIIIESFYQARLSQEYSPIAIHDSVEKYGIKNQITSIISPIE